jgi:iron complex transport system ATP-binding protein
MTSLLALEGVSAGYTSKLDVLRDLSLTVRPGEVVALVGPNGAGKSTLLRVASRVLTPRAGRVLLAGGDMRTLHPRAVARRVAVVPQQADVPFGMTVRELVALGRTPHLHLLAGAGGKDRQAIDWSMQVTAVTQFAERFVDELSSGERQRVLLARALAQQPEVLLLDEPTANLDLQHQVTALDLVRGLARERGLAVIAAIHDLQLAALYCDRVALLDQGRIAALGSPEEVLIPSVLLPTFRQPVVVARHPTHGVPLVSVAPNGHARTV